jgi:glycosyltransferase involved in cell wall biosynthesis
MNSRLVSVIIPPFDAEKCGWEMLNSVLGQTHQPAEVIVVGGGSSDATGSVVKEFAKTDARLQVVRQYHGEAGAAGSKGIGMARGEYIAPSAAGAFSRS